MARLPSLTQLRALDAALRTGSITAAAKELSVTPSAVSHQIKLLEEDLGCQLLEREGRLVAPTAIAREGQDLLRGGFERLSQAVEAFRRAGDPDSLAVSLSASMGYRWLIYRLDGFFQHWPQVDIRFRTHWGTPDLSAEGVDLAVRFGEGPYPGYAETRLTTEVFFPVCSPEFLRRHPKLERPSGLDSALLIHVDSSALSYDYPGWSDWLKAAGLSKKIDRRSGKTFRSDELALRNARFGEGLALGFSTLTEVDLTRGTLVKPFDCNLESNLGYHLVYSERALERPVVAAFAQWLIAAAQAVRSDGG